MVKRNTNFKQVYLVDKYFLDLQKGYNYIPQKQHFDNLIVGKSNEAKNYHTPDRNLQYYHKSNENQLSSANTINAGTQTFNFEDLNIPNDYFLNDSFTQTNGEFVEDANTQTEYDINAQNSQIMGKNINNVITQTEIYEQPYLVPEKIPIQKSYICQLCNQMFANPKTFSIHLKNHKQQKKSSIEKLKSNSRSQDKNYNDTSGGGRSNLQHLRLNKSMASTKRFVDGRNIHDWKNQYLCKICNIKLRTYSSLKSHVNSLHRSRRIRFDFPNNSKYAVIASIDNDMVNISPQNQIQESIGTTDIEMQENSIQDNDIDSNSARKVLPLRIRNDIESYTQFEDNSNIMGPTNIRNDVGTQSNFEDNTNIMGPISVRKDIGDSSRFENDSNIMGPLNTRKNLSSATNLEDNSNVMGPINIRNDLGSSSNFEDNSNVIDTSEEKNGTDEKESMDVTLVEDLQTYWCTKCEQFFRNFNSLREHLITKHNEVAILSKRSKTKEKVKRKIPFYSNYKK